MPNNSNIRVMKLLKKSVENLLVNISKSINYKLYLLSKTFLWNNL